MYRSWWRCMLLSAFSALFLRGQDAFAGDFDSADFSLRFPAAVSRFSTYADVAGIGGASAARKLQSSINPAGVAWEPLPPDTRFTVSPQFSTVGFDQGTRLFVTVESLTIDTDRAGRILASVGQVRSNRATDRQGLGFAFDLDLGQIVWGKRFSDDWAAGFTFTYSQSNTAFGVGSINVSKTDDRTFSGRAGVHYAVTEQLHVGLVLEQAAAPTHTDVFDFRRTGTGTVHLTTTTNQTLVRPGLAFEYAPKSSIFVDYQFGRFANDRGTLVVNRFFAGVAHQLLEGVFLRGGMAADVRGDVAFTAGIGLTPASTVSVDVGFQDNFFPELEPNFGRSRTVAASVSIAF